LELKEYRKSIFQFFPFFTGKLGLPQDKGGKQSDWSCPAWSQAQKRQEGRQPSGTGQGVLHHRQQGLLEAGWKHRLQRILGKIYFGYIIDCGCIDPSKLFKRKYLFQHFQNIFISSIHTDRFRQRNPLKNDCKIEIRKKYNIYRIA
jgi:hypothetical protein